MSELKAVFEKHGQGHVFHYFDKLTAEQQTNFLAQLKQVDPARIQSIFKAATKPKESETLKMEPLPKECFDNTESADPALVASWQKAGMQAISSGTV